ncbi:MAG: phosphate ABC transporter substrate-binding protein, partial [Phormidesmis sp. CAN_BIN36]|nr:phosphate ABC transporter substrate-binding protein [Phormidesmis sp. CAN_BIN36]
MTTNFNYVKCPKCGHDRNPSTATKCEICGTSLRKTGLPVALIGAGLATIAVLGAGAYLLKDKLPGSAPQVAASPDTATVAPNQPTPSASPSSVAIAPNNTSQVPGAVVSTYR